MLILNFGRHLWDFGVIFAVYWIQDLNMTLWSDLFLFWYEGCSSIIRTFAIKWTFLQFRQIFTLILLIEVFCNKVQPQNVTLKAIWSLLGHLQNWSFSYPNVVLWLLINWWSICDFCLIFGCNSQKFNGL